MKIKRNADHEVGPAFGPCVGPMSPNKGESWFCQGTGTETLDPAEPFSLDTVVLCYPCKSMRESRVIEQNTLSIIGERAA